MFGNFSFGTPYFGQAEQSSGVVATFTGFRLTLTQHWTSYPTTGGGSGRRFPRYYQFMERVQKLEAATASFEGHRTTISFRNPTGHGHSKATFQRAWKLHVFDRLNIRGEGAGRAKVKRSRLHARFTAPSAHAPGTARFNRTNPTKDGVASARSGPATFKGTVLGTPLPSPCREPLLFSDLSVAIGLSVDAEPCAVIARLNRMAASEARLTILERRMNIEHETEMLALLALQD